MEDESGIELLVLGEPGTIPKDIREAERDHRRDLGHRTALMVAADWLVMCALKGNAPALAAYGLHRPLPRATAGIWSVAPVSATTGMRSGPAAPRNRWLRPWASSSPPRNSP